MADYEVDLARQLRRLEDRQEIGELPVRYAMAIDMRDLDALVALFVDDVDAGRWGTGRRALKRWYEPLLRGFGRSIHFICGHSIDFVDDSTATGSVYCRAEHEDGDGWYVMAMRYEDTYQRRDGRWYFLRRRERLWYVVDITERPGEPFVRWPGRDRMQAVLPEAFPSWNAFWSTQD